MTDMLMRLVPVSVNGSADHFRRRQGRTIAAGSRRQEPIRIGIGDGAPKRRGRLAPLRVLHVVALPAERPELGRPTGWLQRDWTVRGNRGRSDINEAQFRSG